MTGHIVHLGLFVELLATTKSSVVTIVNPIEPAANLFQMIYSHLATAVAHRFHYSLQISRSGQM